MAEEFSLRVLAVASIAVYITILLLLYITAIPIVLDPNTQNVDMSQAALIALYITAVIGIFFIVINWIMKTFSEPETCIMPVAPPPPPPAPVPAPVPPPPQTRTVYVPRTTYVAETETVGPSPAPVTLEASEIQKLRDADRTVENARRQINALREGINEVIN